jgi:rod shape-determining protein MreC
VQVKRPAPNSPDQEGVSLIRYVVVTVVTPPERWIHNAGLWVRGIWSGYLDLVHVRQEDTELKAKIERLQLEQASLAEDAMQGQRLQQLLDFKQHYVYKTQPAQVIGASGTDQSRTLYIDKGLREGLAPDMPVVTADGIVGKLKDVFDHKSLVVLISDPTSGVGVILQTTRTRGILKGAAFGQLQVINVSPDERIKPGEQIVTSGGDQIFPRGLPVGMVERVVPDPERDPLVDVAVQPAANLQRLEEVLVITNLGDIPPAQAAKDLAESEAEGEAEKKRASDVLSERLPSRLDAKAPADTNPDSAVADAASGSVADNVRLMTPPKPLRPDQYSPDAAPQAAEMTPGERRAPVIQGTEDIVPAAKKPSASLASTGASTGAAGSTGSETSTVKRTMASTTGSTAETGTAASRTAPSSAYVSKPAGGNTLAGGGNATGSVSSIPKPLKPASGSTLQSGTTGNTAGGSSRPSSSLTPGSASASNGTYTSGTSTAGTAPKTRVIVDGPMPNRSSDGSKTTAPVTPTITPTRKAPEIVPDDGSRPPSATKPAVPKPKPAGDNSQPAPPPNGGR